MAEGGATGVGELEGVLENLRALSEEVTTAAVLSRDGELRSSTLPPGVDRERHAAMLAALAGIVRRTSRENGGSGFTQARIGEEGGYVLLVFLGSFGPRLAAVLLTAADEGRSGLKELLGPLLAWRVGIRWYLVVLLGPLAVAWVAIILDGLLGGSGLGLGGLQIPEGLHTSLILLGLLPAFLISLIFGGLRERRSVGGATPCQASGETKRPQLRLDPGRYLGTMAPSAVLYQGTTQSFLAFIPFVLWVTGVSILFTCVYDNTTGSLLIPVLLHTTVNFFAAILAVLPTDVSDSTCPFLPYTLLVCLLTAVVVFVTGPRLSNKTRSRAAPP